MGVLKPAPGIKRLESGTTAGIMSVFAALALCCDARTSR